MEIPSTGFQYDGMPISGFSIGVGGVPLPSMAWGVPPLPSGGAAVPLGAWGFLGLLDGLGVAAGGSAAPGLGIEGRIRLSIR